MWIDDPAFDIGNHVRIHDLGYPGDETSMLEVCSSLNERPLNRSRPLSEMWALTGRADGNVALLIRMHHVVADGIAALDILGVLFDQSAGGTSAAASDERLQPAPRARNLYADHLRGQAAPVSRAVICPRQPSAVGRHLRSRLRQVYQLTR